MPPRTPTPLITVDISKKPWEQEKPLHNRWHPDIPAVSRNSIPDRLVHMPAEHAVALYRRACCSSVLLNGPVSCSWQWRQPTGQCQHCTSCNVCVCPTCSIKQLTVCTQVGEVTEGQLFRVETIDWTGGQIADNDCADDIKHVDLTQVGNKHYPQQCWAAAVAELSQYLPGWQVWAEQWWGGGSSKGKQRLASTRSGCMLRSKGTISYGPYKTLDTAMSVAAVGSNSCCSCSMVLCNSQPHSSSTCWVGVFLQVHYLSGPIRVVDADGVPAQPGRDGFSCVPVLYQQLHCCLTLLFSLQMRQGTNSVWPHNVNLLGMHCTPLTG